MADEPAVDFGTFLRQAREKRGISLQQVSATTKISVRVLESLERNDPRKLPGGIFSRAFVRSYAREVGLDPEVAVDQFVAAFPEQATTESTPAAVVPDDPETFESRRRAATTIVQLLGISLLIVILVVAYYTMRPREPQPVRVVSEAVQEPPSAPPTQPPAGQPGSEPPPGAQPSAEAASGATGAAAGGAPSQPAGAAPAPAAAAPVPAAGPPAATAVADAPLTIGIATTDACWLSLTVDGTRVIARTLEAGEHVSYPVRTGVTIIAGNAGAVSLTLNGKAAKPIGVAGQVVTTTITPETARNFLQQP